MRWSSALKRAVGGGTSTYSTSTSLEILGGWSRQRTSTSTRTISTRTIRAYANGGEGEARSGGTKSTGGRTTGPHKSTGLTTGKYTATSYREQQQQQHQQRGGGLSSAPMRPSIRDHSEAIHRYQEESAEELRRGGRVGRARAKYEQRVQREGGSGLSKDANPSTTLQSKDAVRKEAGREEVFVPSTKKGGLGGASSETARPSPRPSASPSPRPSASPSSLSSSSPYSSSSSSSSSSPSLSSSFSDDESSSPFDALVADDVMKKFYHNEPPRDVHVVETAEEARRVVALLMTDEMAAGRTFACDTEVMRIDVTRESPCCHGTVTCFSLYCGPDVDFGGTRDDTKDINVNRTMLWVDTWLNGDEDRAAEAREILETFRPFFESSAHRKVWHNYSFDRHVMERMGITCQGFFGDTMHMARLWDSSRTGRGG